LSQKARLAARLDTEAPDAHHPDVRLDAALQAEIEAERAGPADPERWRACADRWQEAGRPYDETHARVRLVEALFAVDARNTAREALGEAAADASSLGAGPLRALADDLARRARVSPEHPRRREPDRDEPTARELDVLAILADGLTNREIATRLFLSPKTVGSHVSRLLRKLDAHTRGEAVAVARRRGLLA
jgi:DNA-binding CsgD family transcriptional regulator